MNNITRNVLCIWSLLALGMAPCHAQASRDQKEFGNDYIELAAVSTHYGRNGRPRPTAVPLGGHERESGAERLLKDMPYLA
jgi:hypothetical protein